MLHGSGRTTPRVRAELQEAQASSRTLARQNGLDCNTVLKWLNRTTPADAAMGPAKPRSMTLTEGAIVVKFRKRTLLLLNDMLGCLKDNIPKLTRSALHRGLVRNGISRISKDPTSSSKRKTFKNTEIGFVPTDSCELRSAEGKLPLFLAIDHIPKFI